jgi:hypothetical protein
MLERDESRLSREKSYAFWLKLHTDEIGIFEWAAIHAQPQMLAGIHFSAKATIRSEPSQRPWNPS